MDIDLTPLRGVCNSCGKSHKVMVKKIVIKRGATKQLDDVVRYEGWKNPVVICDENTKKYNSFGYSTIILNPNNLQADETAVAEVKRQMKDNCDVLIALGAGTITDITRYIAYDRECPFISIPTAASVDGFLSTVAAMTWNGYKKTFSAVSPLYVYADTDIFSDAPYRLTASGISDLMGKYTAIVDWKIASIVTGEYICDRICKMELEAVATVKKNLFAIKNGYTEAMETLMYALILSGLAMQMIGNSRPASGSEHHFAHLWEMELINSKIEALHGEKVSVGLIIALEEYEKLKNFTAVEYDKSEFLRLVDVIKNKEILSQIIEENTKDPLAHIDVGFLQLKKAKIVSIINELPSCSDLKSILDLVGCKTELSQIGLTDEIRETSINLSPYMRNRLTLMRLKKMLVVGEEPTQA